MFLSGFAHYLDIKNAGRINGLSLSDPIAIFSFACLCLIVIVAIFLLTFTARRSAEEIWTSTTIRRPANEYMPAYKRHRRSTLSLHSSRSSASESAEGLLAGGRRESSLSLISHNTFREAETRERDPEMLFSPQEVSGRSLETETEGLLAATTAQRQEDELHLPRAPEPVEQKGIATVLRMSTLTQMLPEHIV
jgi:hypothetical protein